MALVVSDAQVVEFRSRIVIPLAGIIVGSSMTIAANTMQRLADDVQQRRGQVSNETSAIRRSDYFFGCFEGIS